MKRLLAIAITLFIIVGIGEWIGEKYKNAPLTSITGSTVVVPCGPDDGEGGSNDGQASF